MTTYRQFVDRLEALAIAGVNKRYTQGPPQSLNTADMPAQWVQFPRSNEGTITSFVGNGGWATMIAELVIALEAVGQNTGPENFDAAVDMMDNITTVLRANDCGITMSKVRWNLVLTVRAVAGVNYWVVIATLEGNG
jgi:hypothetical protein